MTLAKEFQEWDRDNHAPDPQDVQEQAAAHSGHEVPLDAPCTEHCTHPEHHQHIQVQEESFKEKWMRAVADGENLRRRLEKEKKEAIDYALFRFGKEIITIADQLAWAVASVSIKDGESDALYTGVSMTFQELERVLGQFGILKINALHALFDPHLHQVIQEQEDAVLPPGTIVNILQNGYTMHDRLLRPAMVVVVKAPTESSDGSKSTTDHQEADA
jgi:molecular chaperone GrpE